MAEQTPLAALELAEATPAVGRGLGVLQTACVRVGAALAEQPGLGPRLRLPLGRLARARRTADAVPFLARAVRSLDASGDKERAQAARLELALALAERGDGSRARAVLREVDEGAPRRAGVALLTAEATQVDLDRLRAATEASSADDRIPLLRLLADCAAAGGDRHGAGEALDRAVDHARQHGADALFVDLSIEAVAQALEAGERGRAQALAEQALGRAVERQDGVAVIALASTVASLCLGAGDAPGAARAAELQAATAETRNHPLALADAAITVSSALLAAGEPIRAVHHLVHVGGRLREAGTEASLNLVKGRLAELRILLGSDAFDAALWSA